MTVTNPRFSTGQCVSTIGVFSDLDRSAIIALVDRHVAGDWGDLDANDKQANELAIEYGDRILSAYQVTMPDGRTEKIYVITEAEDDAGHRLATTVLLASEY